MKSDKKTSIRFSEQQMERMNDVSKKNNDCSRAKVIKSAVDLVTTGTSEIEFDAQINNSQKTSELIEVKRDQEQYPCPHCNGTLHIDADNMKKQVKQEVIVPSFIPAYRCGEKGCNEIHSNPNYQNRPTAICSNCGQFAKNTSGPCPFCLRQGILQQLNPQYLDAKGVPHPN